MAINTRSSKRKTLQINEETTESSRQHDSDIIWHGQSWIGNDQLKHYSAFVKNETEILVHSFVRVLCEGEREEEGNHYSPAYLNDMYEDDKGEKMVLLQWFLSSDEIEHLLDLCTEDGEVFITPSAVEISAECIDGIAAILTPTHFEKCENLLPKTFTSDNFVCYRAYINNGVEAFSLSTLQGYDTQPVLYTLKCAINRQHNKRIAMAAEHPNSEWFPKVNEKVELLSQDSGRRGCWLRCKIVRSSQNLLAVQYCDVDKKDGPGKLEKWIPSPVVADPDNACVRCDGRLSVRPSPDWDSTDIRYEVGAAVDAWCGDGWWEGLVIGRDIAVPSTFQVYFPGEMKFLPVERKYLRISKDWVHNKWISLKPKSDILAFLSK